MEYSNLILNDNSLEKMKLRDKESNLSEYLTDTMIAQIRAYRINDGISQRELSRRSGVTQNIISRMENGLATPQFETLIKLAETLDLDVEIIIKKKD